MGILAGRGGVFGLYVYFTSSLVLASLCLSLSLPLSAGKYGEIYLGERMSRVFFGGGGKGFFP